MGAGHAHAIHHHGHSVLHRMAPEVKVATTFAFVIAVAVTPREALWAFAIDAAVLLTLIRIAGLPARFVLTRLAAILPFIAFAFLLPFIAGGEQVGFLRISVSQEGVWGMVNVLAKATLGATASILLAGTTQPARILTGLDRLHVPPVLTTIAAFMLRYLELLATELGRMRTAMTARGYDPRWLWQAKPVASAAGALFIRSYERGERVHTAMLARGYTGTMPDLEHRTATSGEWLRALPVPLIAALAALTALAL